MTDGSAVERIRRLLRAGAQLADAASPFGRRARELLPDSTHLTPAGIELALTECLEIDASEREIEELAARATPVNVAHVALPANVFVAPLRALALALAESPNVRARPSRREPHFTRILADAAPGLFEIVPELAPRAGDSLWAYGGADTLRAIRARLPEGVTLKAHGPGFGLAVVDAPHATVEAARALVRDIVPFEQRGCLSPRLLLFRGEAAAARGFARLIAAELVRANEQVPAGSLEPDESAEVARFRDTFAYTGVLEAAASGFVAVTEACLEPAPSGRNLLLFPCAELDASLSSIAPNVTAVGVAGNPELVAAVARALPRARVSPLGRMQRPPIDGPVDRR